MKKKAALGLSVNTLVVIIMGMVLLVGGMALLYKFIGGAVEIENQLSEKTNNELERLLINQGKQVALPFQVADISRGEGHVFGLGMLNIGGVGDQFNIFVELSKALDESEVEFTAPEALNWLLYYKKPMTILEGEHKKEGILVNVPKDGLLGSYVFNVKVCTALPCDSSNQYGNTQKFYVNVK
ncbi:hypothetical protein HON71_03790 [Candidatus Woesearchaeota archaeon]|jgi:hypothetical protein|nr:hypothetical protein [Candidatus Woesearchaeota archaeon]MBT5342889.1 hypothetical protein [Candidatus Woesearchaeota archaeon]